jgi:hypothetical protein
MTHNITVTERPSEEYDEIPTVHALTDEQLQALVRHVAMASYRAARYRGQMNAESLEPIQRKMVSRKADEWFEQNKGEYL